MVLITAFRIVALNSSIHMPQVGGHGADDYLAHSGVDSQLNHRGGGLDGCRSVAASTAETPAQSSSEFGNH